jgi:hypothetical protein
VRSHALAATRARSAMGVSAAEAEAETAAGGRSGRDHGRASGGALMPAGFPLDVAAG